MKETIKRATQELRKRPVAGATTGLVGLTALAGCGDSGPKVTVTETITAAPAPAADRAPVLPEGVTVRFPANVQPHVSIRPATLEGPAGDGAPCFKNFWQDEDGKRRPLVQDDPVVVRVDGRCNTPLDDPNVGVYKGARQVPSELAFIAENGDALVVDHYETGQWVQDIRGGSSASNIWLAVVNSAGEEGRIPEVNAGYIDEEQLLKGR